MSFYPVFEGSILNVQDGMIKTHGGGVGSKIKGYMARSG